jgi:SpoU rRNA methylase family enzyme
VPEEFRFPRVIRKLLVLMMLQSSVPALKVALAAAELGVRVLVSIGPTAMPAYSGIPPLLVT